MILASTTLALLPDFGGGELVLVMLAVLILFGPDKLPALAKNFGKIMREVRKATSEVEREFRRAMDEVPDDPKSKFPGHGRLTVPQQPATPFPTPGSTPPADPAPTPDFGDSPTLPSPDTTPPPPPTPPRPPAT